MKEILLTQTRKLFKALAACTAIILLSLFQAGKLYLIGGVIAGYLMGIAWYGLILAKLTRSSGMTVEQAKRQMVSGMILRFVLLLAVLGTAIQISAELFFTVAFCFGLVYVIGLVLLMFASYQQSISD